MQKGFTAAAHAELQSKLRELPSTQREPTGSPPPISVTLARTQSDLEAATVLLKSLYASRGYLVARLGRDPADLIFVAAKRGETMGTLTLRLDGPAGLRADESYGEHLDAARSQGRRACELGRFAIARDARSKPIIGALFASVYEVVHGREITDVFIEVNPRHVPFYRRVFGFHRAAGERMCPRVLAPSVLLRLDVAAFEARLRDPADRATTLLAKRVLTRARSFS